MSNLTAAEITETISVQTDAAQQVCALPSPLWAYLPGMWVVSTLAPDHPCHHVPGRVVCAAEHAPTLGVCTVDGDLVQADSRFVLPDFKDELTVQALYLLVRRAWKGYALTLIEQDEAVSFHVADTDDNIVYVSVGPAYKVFARCLAARHRLAQVVESLSDEEIAMAVAQYVRERRPPSARFVAEETRRQQAAAGRGGADEEVA